METTYFSVVTDIGIKRMLAAVNEEKELRITKFAVGDGGGKTCTPSKNMARLEHEVWRGEVSSCKISRENEHVLVIESMIPSDEGGFTIREMGVYTEDGILIAVSNTPDTQKVCVSDGVVHELILSMEIFLDNAACIQIIVGHTAMMATKKDIEELRQEVKDYLKSIEEITEAEILEWYGQAGDSTDVPDVSVDYITESEIDEMYADSPDYGAGDIGIPDSDLDEMYETEPDYGESDVGIPDSEIEEMYG